MLFRTIFPDAEFGHTVRAYVDKMRRPCNPRHSRRIPGTRTSPIDGTYFQDPSSGAFHSILRPETDTLVQDYLWALEALQRRVQYFKSHQEVLGHLRETHIIAITDEPPDLNWPELRERVYRGFRRSKSLGRAMQRERQSDKALKEIERLRPLSKPLPEGKTRPYVDQTTEEIWAEDGSYYPCYAAYQICMDKPRMSKAERTSLLLAFCPPEAFQTSLPLPDVGPPPPELQPPPKRTWAEAVAAVEAEATPRLPTEAPGAPKGYTGTGKFEGFETWEDYQASFGEPENLDTTPDLPA